jgi:hypothetical protein
MGDKSLTAIVIGSIFATVAVLGTIAFDRHQKAQELNGYVVIRDVLKDDQDNVVGYGKRQVVPKALVFDEMPIVYKKCRNRTQEEKDELVKQRNCDKNYNPSYCRMKLEREFDQRLCATYLIRRN